MKPIFITSEDYNKLNKLITDLVRGSVKIPEQVRKLHEELRRAAVLEREDFPDGVVTLNSKVQLRDLETGELEDWTLTLPQHANPDEQRLSVLAPVGTAILGYAVGDDIEWEMPGGIRRLKIEQVEHDVRIEPELPKSLYG